MRGTRARKRRTVVVDYGRGSIKIALAETAHEAVRFHGIKEIPVPRGSASSDDGREPVSYTHLTLPTICSV